MAQNKIKNLPTHVGLIMDGNGRWAKKRLLPRSAGHNAGMNRMIGLAKRARSLGIRYMTVYALSTENLSRPAEELEKLFSLIEEYFSSYVDELIASGACIRIIGDLTLLPEKVKNTVEEAVKKSPKEGEFTFCLALGYGARSEILNAAKKVGGNNLTQEQFESELYTHGIPDPDFIIRTGGEVRLSNFLLWQAAYAELYFTDTLFPDFSNAKFEKALEAYSKRVRRFGNV